MCDFVPGEVLFSFPDHPGAVEMMAAWFEHHGEEEHVRVLGRLDQRLQALDVPGEARIEPPRQVWRVSVPPGQEVFKANALRRHYQLGLIQWGLVNDPRAPELLLDVSVEPDHLLSLAQVPGGPDGLPGGDVRLTDVHAQYRALCGVGGAPGGYGQPLTVAVVDSGVIDALAQRVVRRVDLVSPEQFGRPEEGSADDQVLHGSAVLAIIADVAPVARFMVYRVADRYGRASEWDVIAALLSMADADVVNLSLAFGFARGDCGTCGRGANSSRSLVFEHALELLTDRSRPPIVVAAAGNAGDASLCYPARFPDVVAVGSLNSRLEVSGFSNTGTRDHVGAPHRRVWFLPGGDDRPGQIEAVATVGPERRPLYGTSFACAYASGLIADLLAVLPRETVRERLERATGEPMVGYAADVHGHGRMSLAALT